VGRNRLFLLVKNFPLGNPTAELLRRHAIGAREVAEL